MAFSDFVAFIKREAVSERRQAQLAKRSKVQAKATARLTPYSYGTRLPPI
jgi:hypothetical protein